MHHTTLRIASNRGTHVIDVMVACTARERMRGLLGRQPLRASEGMLLLSCRLVHTIGMSYPLDLVYLAPGGRVLKVTAALAPYRMDGHWRAHHVLELAAGAAARLQIVTGSALPIGLIGLRNSADA